MPILLVRARTVNRFLEASSLYAAMLFVTEFGGFWISGFATTKVLVLLNHADIHLYEMHK